MGGCSLFTPSLLPKTIINSDEVRPGVGDLRGLIFVSSFAVASRRATTPVSGAGNGKPRPSGLGGGPGRFLTVQKNPPIHVRGLSQSLGHFLVNWALAAFHLGNIGLVHTDSGGELVS